MPTHDRRRYGAAHRAAKRAIQRTLDHQDMDCAEVICLEARDGRSRVIPAGTPGNEWHLAHDLDGVAYLGPAHPRCNDSEGAARGNGYRVVPASQDW